MKLNKKSRAKIFDLHVGLTFDWRETGILRWRILLWMLLFGVCASVAAVFVHVEVPGVRRRGTSRAPWFCFLRIIRACTSMCCAILHCP